MLVFQRHFKAAGQPGRRPTQREQALANVTVVDGYYAPKLTGSDRMKSRADMDAANVISTDIGSGGQKGMLSAAAAQGALTFGLGLFHAHLKRGTYFVEIRVGVF